MITSIWINGELFEGPVEVKCVDDFSRDIGKLIGEGLDNAFPEGFQSKPDNWPCPVVLHPGKLQPPLGIDEYVNKVIKTETIDYTLVLERLSMIPMLRLLHGIIGKMTELGELADNFKRHIFYGTPLLVEEKGGLVEELGDDAWYSALIASVTESLNGDTLAVILEKNIAKLAKRYKKGFSEAEAVNRNIDEEAKALASKNI